MDEILRLWTPKIKIKLLGREMKEILFVIVGLAVLWMCVELQGETHAGNAGLSEDAMNASAVKISGVDFGMKKELEEIQMCIPTQETGSVISENIAVSGRRISILGGKMVGYKAEEGIGGTVYTVETGNIMADNGIVDNGIAAERENDAAHGERAILERTIIPVSSRTPVEIMPIELKVCVYGNGGIPEYTESVYRMDEFAVGQLEKPRRAGKIFTGWYVDAACTMPFDTFSGEEDTLRLYAGWADFPGFICDDNGCIIECTGSAEAISDGILIFPSHEDCTGIRKGALENVREDVYEICIPSNMVYIEPGAFAGLCNLLYIEVLPGNPSYYSEEGILYHKNGTIAAYPQGRLDM